MSQLTKRNTLTTSRANIGARQITQSPLLRLPAELRNLVYEYTLSELIIELQNSDPSTVLGRCRLTAYEKSSYGDHKDLRYFTGLNRTCRKLFAETRLLVLRLNDVSITGETFMAWNCTMSEEEKNAIRTMSMAWNQVTYLDFFHRQPTLTVTLDTQRKQLRNLYSGRSEPASVYEPPKLDSFCALEWLVISYGPNRHQAASNEQLSETLREISGKSSLLVVFELSSGARVAEQELL